MKHSSNCCCGLCCSDSGCLFNLAIGCRRYILLSQYSCRQCKNPCYLQFLILASNPVLRENRKPLYKGSNIAVLCKHSPKYCHHSLNHHSLTHKLFHFTWPNKHKFFNLFFGFSLRFAYFKLGQVFLNVVAVVYFF